MIYKDNMSPPNLNLDCMLLSTTLKRYITSNSTRTGVKGQQNSLTIYHQVILLVVSKHNEKAITFSYTSFFKNVLSTAPLNVGVKKRIFIK